MSNPVIEADELAKLLAGSNPPQVLDVRWSLMGGPDISGYEAAHVPTAQYVDFDEVCTAPVGEVGGRHPLPEIDVFARAVQALGIRPERAVVVYDQGHSLAAARLWWQLTDAGHPEVRVLNGGIAGWKRAGFETESGSTRVGEPSEWVPTPGLRSRVDAHGVQEAVSTGVQIVDVRAAERFCGEVEPIDKLAGHIPGAVNLPMGKFTRSDGMLLPADELEVVLRPVADNAVFSCGSGATASLALLAYESLGRRGARIYPGSWSDWISRDLPVETGPHPLV